MLFLIPFYFVGPFVGVIYHTGCETGELNDFDQMIEVQRMNHDVLIGMGYNEQTAYYKLRNANYYRAEVLALGTSRVMQFKSDYFSMSFYNCGGSVAWNYDEYLNFIKNLNYTPEIILLGLDQWVFNSAWNQQYCVAYEEYQPIRLIHRNGLVWNMTKDFINQKWNFHSINNYSMNYGFNGRVKDNGYQWDGSYYYGESYRNPNTRDYMFMNTFKNIEDGSGRFEWGEHIDNKTCAFLKALLKYCNEKGIEVVGFAPPFAPSVCDKMTASGNYGYLNEISPECEEIFAEYGFEYFDYTDVRELGVNDKNFVDGFHGSEIVYAYMVQDMIMQESALKKYVDETKLDNLLINCYNDLMLLDFVHKR